MSADLRQRLTFDPASGALRDGDTRYVMLREDSLMGMFRRLPGPARADALEAFAASVAEHGAHSAARYRAAEGEVRDLLATIAATAAQLGWGLWRFSHSDARELTLEVENSPFAHGYGASPQAVCAPIAGMFAAVASSVFDAPMQVEEELCAAAGAALCRFGARARRP